MDFEISQSTKFRFSIANRQKQLSEFETFKRQYTKFFDDEQLKHIKKLYPHGICGRNQHKHTVVVDKIANIKIQDFNHFFKEEGFINYANQRLLQLSQEILNKNEQIVWIFDLSGKIMHLASKRMLESLQKIIINAQQYFPEMLHRIIFVNTPMLFDTIWSKITPFISPVTLQKIVIIGDDWEKVLEYAQPQILPQFLGGEISDEELMNNVQKLQKKQSEHSEQEEREVDFSSLKLALSGLKIGGGNSLKSVTQTPLNTEADEK